MPQSETAWEHDDLSFSRAVALALRVASPRAAGAGAVILALRVGLASGTRNWSLRMPPAHAAEPHGEAAGHHIHLKSLVPGVFDES